MSPLSEDGLPIITIADLLGLNEEKKQRGKQKEKLPSLDEQQIAAIRTMTTMADRPSPTGEMPKAGPDVVKRAGASNRALSNG